MTTPDLEITSLANPKIKAVVKLRQRSHRDEDALMIAEGYREIKRALDADTDEWTGLMEQLEN